MQMHPTFSVHHSDVCCLSKQTILRFSCTSADSFAQAPNKTLPVMPESAEGSNPDFLLTAWNFEGLLLAPVGVMLSE
jgi:hypothetical protein